MSDGRSRRKPKVIPFISQIERDREVNFNCLVEKAKILKPDGFDNINWNESSWKITSGRLIKASGKNTKSNTFKFCYAPKLGSGELLNEWSLVAKALLILRFHRKNQSATNQKNLITAIGYIAYCANLVNLDLVKLTPSILDDACKRISKDYKESTAYNLHKCVSEFAGHCDANRLCKVLFKYKYARMKRPSNAGGVGFKRLDDPTVLDTSDDKLVNPDVFKVLGELYKNVPTNHKYRFYILVLTFLLCTGRRFSEISLLPFQDDLKKDNEGREYLEYFPRKASQGDVFGPMRKFYMPTQVLEIVRDVVKELNTLCEPARETAAEMYRTKDVDLRFLSNLKNNERLYYYDLEKFGISKTVLATAGWIRKNNFSKPDADKITKAGRRTIVPMQYTNKKGIIAYCRQGFIDKSHEAFHVDQTGKKFTLKDLMLVRHLGLSSGFSAFWIATECTHSMLSTFMRYLPDLAKEFASNKIVVDFTSHSFRHTLNTLLDEGGLSDIMQTEWFGRTNSNDTKAYQHTSREKRVLMIREDVKKGRVEGALADQIKAVPINVQDGILRARINAAHDVGTGICIHNFSQMPCGRHLECSADCKDYLWVKDDKGRVDDLKRQFAFTTIARETAEEKTRSSKPKKSSDWLAHNDKKLEVLNRQLKDNGVEYFDPHEYMEGLTNG